MKTTVKVVPSSVEETFKISRYSGISSLLAPLTLAFGLQIGRGVAVGAGLGGTGVLVAVGSGVNVSGIGEGVNVGGIGVGAGAHPLNKTVRRTNARNIDLVGFFM